MNMFNKLLIALSMLILTLSSTIFPMQDREKDRVTVAGILTAMKEATKAEESETDEEEYLTDEENLPVFDARQSIAQNNNVEQEPMQEVQKHTTATSTRKKHKYNYPGCNKTYVYERDLNDHERLHTGENIFRCTWNGCTREFTRKQQLTNHKRTHTGEKPYKCKFELCNYAGVRADYLSRHQYYQHNYCYKCKRQFASRDKIDSHIQENHRRKKRKRN